MFCWRGLLLSKRTFPPEGVDLLGMASVPETIGSYKVVRELGRGAMGVVYLCLHPSLGRQVAVKVLPGQVAEEADFLERFRREGEMAARLRHPNIVQVYDFSSDGNQYFIVMEYLGSQTLKAGGTRNLSEACRLIDQLLSALEHAHENGVVHRDLKPSNILLTDKNDIALTDFGIAHSAANQKLTQTGTALGTPEYMAPEQFDGKADARSDLYAVGIIFYELLTGFTPFRGETLTEVMKNQVLKTPEPLCEVDFTIPASLSAVVSKCLAKDPQDRYQSAGEMRQAIQAALREPQPPRAPIAPAPSPQMRAQPRPHRSRPRKGRDGRALLALLIMLSISWAWQKINQRPRAQPPVVSTPSSNPRPVELVVTDSPTPVAPDTPAVLETPTPALTLSETPELSATPDSPESMIPEAGVIQPGVGVAGVNLGDTEEEVQKKWGPPASRFEENNEINWGIFKKDENQERFALTLDKTTGKLTVIHVYMPDFSVQDHANLVMGVTLEEVRKELPDPSAETNASLDYDHLGIYFYFANRGMRGKARFGEHGLEFIRIYEPGHSPAKS
jgi:serine/threonine protein kinase